MSGQQQQDSPSVVARSEQKSVVEMAVQAEQEISEVVPSMYDALMEVSGKVEFVKGSGRVGPITLMWNDEVVEGGNPNRKDELKDGMEIDQVEAGEGDGAGEEDEVGGLCSSCEMIIRMSDYNYHRDGECESKAPPPSASTLSCDWKLCDTTQTFTTQGELYVHMTIRHGPRIHRCSKPGCPSSFSSLQSLREHEAGAQHNLCPVNGCGNLAPQGQDSQHVVDVHPETFTGKHVVVMCRRPGGGCFVKEVLPDANIHHKKPHQQCKALGCVCVLTGDLMKEHVWLGYHLASQQEVELWAEGGMVAVEAKRNEGTKGPSANLVAGYKAVAIEIVEHAQRCEGFLQRRNLIGTRSDIPDIASRFALPTPNYALTLRRHPVLVDRTTEIINPFYELSSKVAGSEVDLDIALDPAWTIDFTFCEKVLRDVSNITRLSGVDLLGILRASEANVVKVFVATRMAERYRSTFGLYGALNRYLQTDPRPPSWEAQAELAHPKAGADLVGNNRTAGWRFDKADMDIAGDAMSLLIDVLGLTKQQFAIWQLAPPGTRLKSGPRLFSRQIGAARDLLVLSIKARSMQRSGHSVSDIHWMTEKVDYTRDSESIDFLVQGGLHRLLQLEPIPVLYTRYTRQASAGEEDTSAINRAVHGGIATAMFDYDIVSYQMLVDVFNNPDQDFHSSEAGPYNRDEIRLVIWTYAASPAILGPTRMPPLQETFFVRLKYLIELLRAQEKNKADGQLERQEGEVGAGQVWTPYQVMMLDFCWYAFGYFDGLTGVIADVLRTSKPPHDMNSVTATVHAYQGRWAGKPRTEAALMKFVEDKASLRQLYVQEWKRGPYSLRALGLPFELPDAKLLPDLEILDSY